MSFLRNLFGRFSIPAPAPIPAPAIPPPPESAPIGIPVPPAPPHPEQAAAPLPPEDSIAFPLKAITDLFPPELKPALHKQPSEHVQVYIPRGFIRPQLAAGVVRITFAQLRAATPEIFFNAEAAPPDAKIILPLESILRQMTPCRREDQRLPSIPVNIPSVFVKAGQPRPIAGPIRGSADPWYSQRRPAFDAKSEPTPEPRAAPSNGRKPLQPPAPQPAPTPAVTQAAAPSAPPPAPSPPDTFAIPLSAVLASLSEEIRHALVGSDAQSASFLIPLGEFESRMRTGKLAFKWAQLRDWCSVPLAAPVAPDTDIDLPLAVVAPLFMAARKAPDLRKQVEIDTRIPDVFSKSKISSRVHIAAQAPAAPEPPAPPPEPAPAPVAATGPAQIVEYLRALDGVAGVFIATADGLMVASDVPNANENVLAAFAPTVFAQLTKYADMARIGLPESIDIHLGDGATVHVRKAGKLFLGVLALRDRPLPIQELIRISAALQPRAS